MTVASEAPATRSRLADDRSLEVLDFDAIRTLLAKETLTDRATAHARTLVPHVDLATVRLEQAATVEMRRIANDSAFNLPRTREVGEGVARAVRGGTLSPEELRDIGIALAAAINAATVRRAAARRRGAGSPAPGFAEPGDETPDSVLF